MYNAAKVHLFMQISKQKPRDVNAHNKLVYLFKMTLKPALLFKKCYKNNFFCSFSCTFPQMPLSLHRVFHSIRFKVTKVGSKR